MTDLTAIDEARTSKWPKRLQLVVVPVMYVFITCFKFWTIYQVGGLQ